MTRRLCVVFLFLASGAVAGGCAGLRHWTVVDAEAGFSEVMRPDEGWTVTQLEHEFSSSMTGSDAWSFYHAQQVFAEQMAP